MNDFAKTVSDNILKEDPEIECRIQNGIEVNRKGFGSIELYDQNGKPIQSAELELRLVKHEYNFGCNVFMLDQFEDPEKNNQYESMFRETFNLAVVPFYWSHLEPEDGQLRFEASSSRIYRRPPPDRVVSFCEENGITPKGHPLFWHSHRPYWLTQRGKDLETRIERHFEEIAARYADKVNAWDVINEMLDWKPLQCLMPKNPAEFCFRMARKHFPSNTLLYNDVSRVSWQDYRREYTPLCEFVSRLLRNGCDVGGLGLQYHQFFSEERLLQAADNMLNPRYLYACLDQYATLNIPINISEITIVGSDNLGDGEAFQEIVAEKLYRLWFSHPSTDGIIWWNLVDDTANPSHGCECGVFGKDENLYKGGMLRKDLSPKRVCETIQNLIKNEWMTQTKIQYETRKDDNTFRGFYGDYEIRVNTNSGKFMKKISLRKKSENLFRIQL